MLDITQSPKTPSKYLVEENDWDDSLQYLERELATYRQATASSATPEEVRLAADRVAAAVARSMEYQPRQESKDVPPSYQTSFKSPKGSDAGLSEPAGIPKARKLKRTSHASDDAESDTSSVTQQNAGKQVGRGLLMFVATPFAIAGMALYGCGMMLEGSGMILKGAGSIGKTPLQNVRKSLKGKKRSNRK